MSLLGTLLLIAAANGAPTLAQLQGAWWAQEPAPTVAFAIDGNCIWFDNDNQYHPLQLEDDVMVVDLGPDQGLVKSRIIRVGEGELVLQDIEAATPPRVYTLAEPAH